MNDVIDVKSAKLYIALAFCGDLSCSMHWLASRFGSQEPIISAGVSNYLCTVILDQQQVGRKLLNRLLRNNLKLKNMNISVSESLN